METAGAAGVDYYGGGQAYVRLMWSISSRPSATRRYKGAGGLGDVLPMQVGELRVNSVNKNYLCRCTLLYTV